MRRGFLLTTRGRVGALGAANPNTSAGDLVPPPEVGNVQWFPTGDTGMDYGIGFRSKEVVFQTLPEPRDIPERLKEGWTECVFDGTKVQREVLSAKGFPKPVPNPPSIRHTISRSSLNPGQEFDAGLGMFATTDLGFGDLVLAERPLLLFSQAAAQMPVRMIEGKSFEDCVQDSKEELGRLVEKAVERMPEERRSAFMVLANSHLNDGSAPALGIMWTNSVGFSLAGEPHSAVYNEMSRINHSCSPNAFIGFDSASFSGKLYAMQPIKKGEEITVAYCNVLLPAAERGRKLVQYQFQCSCRACRNAEVSDALRGQIEASFKRDEDIDSLHLKISRAEARDLLRQTQKWIKTIEDEGVTETEPYAYHLSVAMKCSTMPMDLRGLMLYSQMLTKWKAAVQGECMNDKIQELFPGLSV